MLKKIGFQFIAFSFLSVLLFNACSKDADHSTIFNLRMTDDPLDNVDEVNIDLLRIIVFTNEGKDSVDIGTNAGIYNLLDYQGDLDTLIGSAVLQAETISQIRLVLGTENSIMVNSVLHDLKTPSAQQSGLKINVHANIADLDVYNLLIDFDAEQSIVTQGNGNYSLKPVIKVMN
jgi:hypothetical protein